MASPIVQLRQRLFGSLIVVLAGTRSGPVRHELLVLADVTVIDGNGGSLLPHTTLMIGNGRITDLFPSGQKPLPEAAEVLHTQGRYVIPGLIDTHVHLTLNPEHLEMRLASTLHGGVTAVRDMGGDTAWLAELSEQSGEPVLATPQIYFAVALAGPTLLGRPRTAPAMTAAGFGMVPWLTTITAYTPVRRAVGFIKSTGATGLKIYSDVPHDVVCSLVAEGHRQGLKVWGHARVFPEKPSELVDAGLDVISHSSLLACEVSTGPSCDHHGKIESEPLKRVLTMMRTRGTVLEPTLAVQQRVSVDGGADPNRHDSAVTLDWGIEATRQAHRLGVRIAAGSDLPLESGASLPSIHDEMELLVRRAGLTPLEAITAATRTGAEILGIDGVSGTIAIGKQADVVVLADDPSRDIRNTRRVVYVIKRGHLAGDSSAAFRH